MKVNRGSDNKKVQKKTSEDLGIPEYIVSDVVRSFFQMAVEDIKSGNMKGTKMIKFGKFVIKEKRKELYELERLDKEFKEREEEQ